MEIFAKLKEGETLFQVENLIHDAGLPYKKILLLNESSILKYGMSSTYSI